MQKIVDRVLQRIDECKLHCVALLNIDGKPKVMKRDNQSFEIFVDRAARQGKLIGVYDENCPSAWIKDDIRWAFGE